MCGKVRGDHDFTEVPWGSGEGPGDEYRVRGSLW